MNLIRIPSYHNGSKASQAHPRCRVCGGSDLIESSCMLPGRLRSCCKNNASLNHKTLQNLIEFVASHYLKLYSCEGGTYKEICHFNYYIVKMHLFKRGDGLRLMSV